MFQGQAWTYIEGEAHRELRERVISASLGALEMSGSKRMADLVRLFFDGTHRAHVNKTIWVRDQDTSPEAPDIARVLRGRFKNEVKDAHRLIPFAQWTKGCCTRFWHLWSCHHGLWPDHRCQRLGDACSTHRHTREGVNLALVFLRVMSFPTSSKKLQGDSSDFGLALSSCSKRDEHPAGRVGLRAGTKWRFFETFGL